MIAPRTLLFPFASGRARREPRQILSAIIVKRNVMAWRRKVDKTERTLLSPVQIDDRDRKPV